MTFERIPIPTTHHRGRQRAHAAHEILDALEDNSAISIAVGAESAAIFRKALLIIAHRRSLKIHTQIRDGKVIVWKVA